MKFRYKVLLGVAAIMAVTYGVRYIYVAATTTTVTDTFTRDSERVCSQDDAQKCKYIAFGQNETYENTDEWVFLKYNSSDVNRFLVKGATCTMKVYGKRIKWLSWYRNIITADCADPIKFRIEPKLNK
jgi:hypothetical protein